MSETCSSSAIGFKPEALVSGDASRRAEEGFARAYANHSPSGQELDTHVEDDVRLTEAGTRRLAASWFAKLAETGWRAARISGPTVVKNDLAESFAFAACVHGNS